MRMFVFLDDERNPEDVTWMKPYKEEGIEWKVIRNYQDFCSYVDSLSALEIGSITFCFDHDIQDFDKRTGRERTGLNCLQYLAYQCSKFGKPMPSCHFHTKNPVGKQNMENLYRFELKHFLCNSVENKSK